MKTVYTVHTLGDFSADIDSGKNDTIYITTNTSYTRYSKSYSYIN